MTPNQKYMQSQRERGLTPCTVWVPTKQVRALQLYAAALREDATKPAAMRPANSKEKQK